MPKFCHYRVTVKTVGRSISVQEAKTLIHDIINLFDFNYCSPEKPADGLVPHVLACVTDYSEPVEQLEFHVRNNSIIETIPNIFEAVKDWSENNPEYTLSVHETNADLPSDQRFVTVCGGLKVRDNNARIIPADMTWDAVTVKAIVKHLLTTRHNDAADAIKAAFDTES